MNKLFPHDLTPQRRYLLRQTWERITRKTLRTSDLQLCLLHFREMKLDDWFWESASSIAHARRDQGLLWSWVLNVWTTHLYYQNLNRENITLDILPMDVYRTIVTLIETREERQLFRDLSYIYPHGITKAELMATLEHLYSPEKMLNRRQDPPFVHLVSKAGNASEDLQLMRALVLECEPMALSIPPTPITELVEVVDQAFRRVGISPRSLTEEERIYIQLHLLVSFHNVLFDVESKVFRAVTGIKPPRHEAMLSVSVMDQTLGIDIAFYYKDEDNYLEQADLHSSDRFERFRCPLLGTDLEPQTYLLESDGNIRSCLFNHPLEVRTYEGVPVIVALERDNGKFTRTRSRSQELTHPWD